MQVSSERSSLNNEVLFLVPSSIYTGDIADKIFREEYSTSASTRLHLYPAIRSVSALGLTPRVLGLNTDQPDCLDQIFRSRLCVIAAKLLTPPEHQDGCTMANLACIARLRRLRVPILSVYSDNWCITNNLNSEFYKDILALSNCIVFPTKSIAEQGITFANNEAFNGIIEDPCFLPRTEYPVLNRRETCRIVWFGHNSNAMFLLDILPSLIKKCNEVESFELTIMSDKMTVLDLKKEIQKQKYDHVWQFRFVIWETKIHAQELERAHICLIPSDRTSRKAFASHNRAVDAIQSGCMVVATPLDSYQELDKCLLLGDNFSPLINKGINQYDRLIAKWDANREEILARFSPKNNEEKWKNCILKLLNS